MYGEKDVREQVLTAVQQQTPKKIQTASLGANKVWAASATRGSCGVYSNENTTTCKRLLVLLKLLNFCAELPKSVKGQREKRCQQLVVVVGVSMQRPLLFCTKRKCWREKVSWRLEVLIRAAAQKPKCKKEKGSVWKEKSLRKEGRKTKRSQEFKVKCGWAWAKGWQNSIEWRRKRCQWQVPMNVQQKEIEKKEKEE